MTLSKIISVALLTCASLCACAQKTILFGTNPTYANLKIDAYACTDYISGTNTLVGSAVADSLGNFSIELDITGTCRVALDLGRARGILYADTAMTYNVVLPDYEAKTKGDMMNPFFEPEDFLVGIKNPDRYNVNMYIDMFDYAYEEYLERNYYTFMRKPEKAVVDSLIADLEQSFDTIPNEFFRIYRSYKYAWLKYMSYMRDWRYMSREYFNDKPVAYDNPAYMDLFNQMFGNFLRFYMNTREGERIYSDVILAKSPSMAKQTLSNCLAVTNDTLQEMVLLKGIQDALYDYYFKTSSLLITLDSIKATSNIERHRQIAQNIEQKKQVAKVGTSAPGFCLADTVGVYHDIEEYRGKFVYVNFISVDSYSCIQDLEQMKKFYEKTKVVMHVVSISVDDDFNKAKDYFRQKGYEWELLDYKGDPTVVERYKVRAYPSYFLVDVDGTMLISPASNPSENFEKRFRQIYNERQHKSGN